MTDYLTMLEEAKEREARRAIFRAQPVECPSCKSKQVQILLSEVRDTSAGYKCRMCKQGFVYHLPYKGEKK